MTSIEKIALEVINALEIKVNPDINNKIENNYLGVNKLNIVTKYPSWFYYKYSKDTQINVNKIIKENFDKVIQQRVYEILTKET